MMESASTQHALAFLDRCPVPMLIRKATGRITGFNAAFAQLVGQTTAHSLLDLDSEALHAHPVLPLLENKELICWSLENGQTIFFETRDFTVADSDETHARIFIDVSRQVQLDEANQKLIDELEQHVMTDPLTGLLNRRGVVLALEPQVARSRRYNSSISVIVMHIDATTQHDSLIVDIARLLKDQLRWADLIGRADEHELILVLPETTAQAAIKLADKIKCQIDELISNTCPGENILTSYGITDWRKVDNATSLINRAEKAVDQVRHNESGHSLAV